MFKTQAEHMQRQLFAMLASGYYTLHMKMGCVIVTIEGNLPRVMSVYAFFSYLDDLALDEFDTIS